QRMRPHSDASLCPFSARKLRSCREHTLGQIRLLMKMPEHAGRLKLNSSSFGHGQQIGDAFLGTGDPLVFLGSEQHMRWAPSVGDEDGPPLVSALGPARVLIELAAG